MTTMTMSNDDELHTLKVADVGRVGDSASR